jgi:hypothetical protein
MREVVAVSVVLLWLAAVGGTLFVVIHMVAKFW